MKPEFTRVSVAEAHKLVGDFRFICVRWRPNGEECALIRTRDYEQLLKLEEVERAA